MKKIWQKYSKEFIEQSHTISEAWISTKRLFLEMKEKIYKFRGFIDWVVGVLKGVGEGVPASVRTYC